MDYGRRLLFNPSTYHENVSFLGQGSSSVAHVEEPSKRRPFFSSSDNFFVQEFNDEQLSEKKRRLTSEQVQILEKSFEGENKLEPERKKQLAKELGLQPRQVAIWFQNRRARYKTEQIGRDCDDLKSSYDSLRADYDYVFEENQKLKVEVLSLTEKLQAKEEVKAPAQVTTETSESPLSAFQHNMKVEDPLSSGSTVMDGDCSPHIVDTGNSYFPYQMYTTGCDADDGCAYGGTYFSSTAMFGAPEMEERQAALGWWDWS